DRQTDERHRFERKIAALVPDYLKHRKEEVDKIEAAISEGDFEWIAQVGHRLRGNAKTYGFEPLGVLGESLQKAATSRNVSQIRTITGSMNDFLTVNELAEKN